MLTRLVRAYPYWWLADDENIQAFIEAYNRLGQDFIDAFVNLNLPVYPLLTGSLLDWVGQGVYGVERPLVPSAAMLTVGPLNTWPLNTLPLNTVGPHLGPDFELASDDIYKRVLTWRFYKGDGYQFTIPWLKRRLVRFLEGVNGTDPGVQETYAVSVQFIGTNVAHIRVVESVDPLLLATLVYLIRNGVLALPFQFVFDVVA